ncbi:MAG: GspH/FimT family pseudopilin [Desulfofustis sp.]|nr:GspH/FimT family pseudopilin [Desulfofustis sp.]
MRQNSGFSLIEVVVTIAIIGILTAIALPPILTWRQTSQFVGAIQNLTADLQRAKLVAVKENTEVQVELLPGSYTVFVDLDANDTLDAGENTLAVQQLPLNVTITSAITEFDFVGTGTVPDIASEVEIRVDGAAGRQGFVRVNMLGRISQAM